METTKLWLCKLFLADITRLALVQPQLCFWGLHLSRRDQKGQQASGKKDKKTVKWKMWTVGLTCTPLCRRSSAWLSALWSLVIRRRCKILRKDPNKNLEASWTDQESGRSWMTFSASKAPGLLLSRSTATLTRSSEPRYVWSRLRNRVCPNCESLPWATLRQKASAASGSWPWTSTWSASEYFSALPRRMAFSLCRGADLIRSETG